MDSQDYQQYQQESNIFASTGRKVRYWIFVMQKGRWVNIGSEENEAAATERALTQCPEYHYEIRAYNTTDISEANRRWKYEQLNVTHDLNLSTQRMVRKPQKKEEETEESWASLGGF